MRPKQKRANAGLPLDAKKRELLDQQTKLDAEKRKLEALIEDAPRIQEQETRRRREELSSLSANGQRRVDAPRSIESRYEFVPPKSAPPRRSLKRDKRYVQLKFFALSLAFIVVLFWLYSVMR